MSLTSIETQYRQAVAGDMGFTAEIFETRQTLVLPESGRAGSNMAVAYQIGGLTVIRCDPAIEAALGPLANDEVSLEFEEFEAWANNVGWELVDGGDVHLLLEGLIPKGLPGGAIAVALDRESANDVDTIAELLSASDPLDVDAAEIDLDELDPIIIGLVDSDGRLGSYASAAVWDEDSQFDDIGVLTRPDLRGSGWGAAAVTTLCEASHAAGRIPIYRCNWSRGASKALAVGLGFVQVGTLLAYLQPDS